MLPELYKLLSHALIIIDNLKYLELWLQIG